jgi:hypothetical protein
MSGRADSLLSLIRRILYWIFFLWSITALPEILLNGDWSSLNVTKNELEERIFVTSPSNPFHPSLSKFLQRIMFTNTSDSIFTQGKFSLNFI